ncbi:hypothetical protein AwDysgo_03420 [Bacteroidales bacterium]|nr:hypothetical protein AwDysgo_03420 [Bacteroidales bacterium]
MFSEASAQFVMRNNLYNRVAPDSIDLDYYSKKKPLQAVGEIVALNLGVWSFDRYILKGDFAYISLNTIKDNFKKGFVWDNDKLPTNLFNHPYNGNLFYNSARSSGFNYWQSGGFALGGSLMWEMFMEREFPSTNDVIATPIGGMALGEIFYRTSDLVLDDRARGGDRFGRELAGLVISPMRGLSRIVSGDAWRVRPSSGSQFGSPELSVELSAGVRFLELKDKIFDKGSGFTSSISIEYGDKFDNESVTPYDYFNIVGNINIHSSQPLIGQINAMGRLWGSDLVDSKKDYLGLAAFQYFDFYDSDTISSVSNKKPYEFGTPASFGLALLYKDRRHQEWHMDGHAHLSAILLGATLSDYYALDERNYNWGSGFGWKAGVNISFKDKIGFSWLHEGYRIFTWEGYPEDLEDLSSVDFRTLNVQGDKSNAILHATTFRSDIKIYQHNYFSILSTLYSRRTNYAYYADIESLTGELRFMYTYKF